MTKLAPMFLFLACCAAGCPAQVSVAPLLGAGGSIPMPGPSVLTALPGLSTPSPLTDPTQAAFFTRLTPQAPCPGQQAEIEGQHFTGVHHVEAWLGSVNAYAPYQPPGSPSSPIPGVKLGEADTDANGSFRITFRVAERMGPTADGREIVLQPGGNYGLGFKEGGKVVGPGIGFQVCQDFSPPPFEAHLEPAAPCAGATTHVLGTGFTGPVAKLQFAWLQTRFNDGPRVEREAPVGPDGRLDFALDPATFKDGQGNPFFDARGRYVVTVFDPATSRAVPLPIPYCNATLADALAATGVAPEAAVQGRIERTASLPPAPQAETATLRSQADLDAWVARHQMDARLVAKLPAVDFTRSQVVVTGEEPGGTATPLTAVEIAAVEGTADGYQVRSIRWSWDGPVFPAFVFDFVVVPRKDGPVTFLPSATGNIDERPATRLRHQRLEDR